MITRGPLAFMLNEYRKLYTEYLSEGLILAYQQAHQTNKKQQWQKKAVLISMNVQYMSSKLYIMLYCSALDVEEKIFKKIMYIHYI